MGRACRLLQKDRLSGDSDHIMTPLQVFASNGAEALAKVMSKGLDPYFSPWVKQPEEGDGKYLIMEGKPCFALQEAGNTMCVNGSTCEDTGDNGTVCNPFIPPIKE